MRVKIKGVEYSGAVDLDGIQLKNWLRFERETALLGQRITKHEATALVQGVIAATGVDRLAHPDLTWCVAILHWARLVTAAQYEGTGVPSLEEAISYADSDVEYLADADEDDVPGEGGADDAPSPTVAAPRGPDRDVNVKKNKTKTSGSRSTPV